MSTYILKKEGYILFWPKNF